MLRSVYWEIKLDIKSTMRYRFGVISDTIVYSLLLCFFIFAESGQSYGDKYQYENYKELMVIGYFAWFYAVTAITTISQIVMGELRLGTLYRKLNSNYPLQILLFGRLIAALIIQSLIATVMIIVSVCLGNVKLGNHFQIVLPILLSTLGMYGIGLFVAGLSLYFKRIGAITYIIQLGLLFITDTVSVGASISAISKYMPLTICNDIIRKQVSGISCMNEMLVLILSVFIFLILGIISFKIMIYCAKRKGNLLFY